MIELPGGVDSQTAFLQLNMSEMLNKVCTYGDKQYEDLIVDEGGVQYVHGGIAMYGGGKNYGMVDFSDFDGELPTEYHVNLSVLAIGEESSTDSPLYLQGTMLPLAAGTQDFRFFMYNEESDSSISAKPSPSARRSASSSPPNTVHIIQIRHRQREVLLRWQKHKQALYVHEIDDKHQEV